jgi:hypothetical protein
MSVRRAIFWSDIKKEENLIEEYLTLLFRSPKIKVIKGEDKVRLEELSITDWMKQDFNGFPINSKTAHGRVISFFDLAVLIRPKNVSAQQFKQDLVYHQLNWPSLPFLVLPEILRAPTQILFANDNKIGQSDAIIQFSQRFTHWKNNIPITILTTEVAGDQEKDLVNYIQHHYEDVGFCRNSKVEEALNAHLQDAPEPSLIITNINGIGKVESHNHLFFIPSLTSNLVSYGNDFEYFE